MYRAFCQKCNTLIFDMPSIDALFEGKEKAQITCRGCNTLYTLTHDEKTIYLKSGKRKPVKATKYAG